MNQWLPSTRRQRGTYPRRSPFAVLIFQFSDALCGKQTMDYEHFNAMSHGWLSNSMEDYLPGEADGLSSGLRNLSLYVNRRFITASVKAYHWPLLSQINPFYTFQCFLRLCKIIIYPRLDLAIHLLPSNVNGNSHRDLPFQIGLLWCIVTPRFEEDMWNKHENYARFNWDVLYLTTLSVARMCCVGCGWMKLCNRMIMAGESRNTSGNKTGNIQGIHKGMVRFQKNPLLIPHRSFVYALYV
jgi:hypothetical protein